jgi:hypothetical protein
MVSFYILDYFTNYEVTTKFLSTAFSVWLDVSGQLEKVPVPSL